MWLFLKDEGRRTKDKGQKKEIEFIHAGFFLRTKDEGRRTKDKKQEIYVES